MFRESIPLSGKTTHPPTEYQSCLKCQWIRLCWSAVRRSTFSFCCCTRSLEGPPQLEVEGDFPQVSFNLSHVAVWLLKKKWKKKHLFLHTDCRVIKTTASLNCVPRLIFFPRLLIDFRRLNVPLSDHSRTNSPGMNTLSSREGKKIRDYRHKFCTSLKRKLWKFVFTEMLKSFCLSDIIGQNAGHIRRMH